MKNITDKINSYFSSLTFSEDGHKYFVNNEEIKTSVSGLIKKYKYHTDWNKIIERIAKKENTTPEEISKRFKNSSKLGCDIGTATHKYAEDYASGIIREPLNGYEKGIKNFWENKPDFLIPIGTEIKMYHKKLLFAGTLDQLFLDSRDNRIIILDWKTNRNLFNNFKNQKMNYPFNNMLCCAFNHYQLQQSYYQILLEQVPDIKVSERRIVWVKPNGQYVMYSLDDLTQLLKKEHKLC